MKLVEVKDDGENETKLKPQTTSTCTLTEVSFFLGYCNFCNKQGDIWFPPELQQSAWENPGVL